MMHRTPQRELQPGDCPAIRWRHGRMRRPGSLLAGLFCLLAPSLIGCPPDNRISLDALRRLEGELTTEMASDDIKQVEPAQLAVAENRPYTVGPRDVLSITLLGAGLGGAADPYTPFTMRARVDEDGRVTMPQVGQVELGGKTLAEAEKAVHDAHVPDYLREVSVFVEVVSTEVTTVLVTGAATTRGLISLRSNERNVLYALALSGGYAVGTSGVVTIKHRDPGFADTVYDLTQPEDIRRALLSPPLASGDIIEVDAASTSAIYLTGLVNAPGPIAIPTDSKLTVSQAISAGGGLADFVDPPEGTLWRKLPDGQQVRVKINLAKIMSGQEPDFVLQAGDILDVPHTPGTRFRAWVLANIRLGPFGVSAVWDPIAGYRYQKALDQDERRFGQQGGFGQSILDTVRFGLPNVIVPPVLPPQ
jgi:polysaccharide export outer membrane protein